jgi:hypothetical protein
MSDDPKSARVSAPMRRRIPACALAAFVAGAALAAVPRAVAGDAPRPDLRASVLTIDEDGFRYAYHATTGTEALFDVKNDPRLLVNVLDDHPLLAGSLRRSLERRLHVDTLESLRALHADSIRRLQTLGYL